MTLKQLKFPDLMHSVRKLADSGRPVLKASVQRRHSSVSRDHSPTATLCSSANKHVHTAWRRKQHLLSDCLSLTPLIYFKGGGTSKGNANKQPEIKRGRGEGREGEK